MSRELKPPITCLVTSGETTHAGEGFRAVLELVAAAVAARVSVIQLREKALGARTLYELAARAADLARGSATRVLVNDRADIALSAGCDGVHLTAQSLDARTVRRAFGDEFLVGVSAHSPGEARAARDGGADFAVLGPVFDTPSKRAFGPPLGVETFAAAARELAPFPLLAIGGVASDNLRRVLQAGARGVAAIRLFGDAAELARTVREIEDVFNECAAAAFVTRTAAAGDDRESRIEP